jgi:septum formation protein
MKLVLGSQSQGRKSVLEKMGYDFEIVVADIDEKLIRDSDPKKLTLKIANAKADEVIKKVDDSSIIITSDSVVVANGNIIEKPVDENEAREHLKDISNNVAQKLVSAVVLVNTSTNKRFDGVSEATVVFNKIPQENIDKFIVSGDVFKVAGSFAVEHPFFKPFIKEINGEIETITGLPKELTQKLLQKAKN